VTQACERVEGPAGSIAVLRAAVGELKGVLGSEIEARRRATSTVSADAARLRESDRQTDRQHLLQVE
jgi:hypothetical protein